jgi:hypothetical protein
MEWRHAVFTRTAAASKRVRECWEWLHQIDKCTKIGQLFESGFSDVFGNWEGVDMELATAIQLRQEPLRRAKQLEIDFAKSNPGVPLLMNGRMIIFLLDDYYKIKATDRKTIEWNQFLSLKLQNNDLRDFKNKFTNHVGKMVDPPSDYMLEEHFRQQICHHPDLKIYFELYREMAPGDPNKTYASMLQKLERHFELETDEKKRAEMGLSQSSKQQRVVAGISNDGICRVWKSTGYCARQTEHQNCEYAHPKAQKGIDKGKGKGKRKGKDQTTGLKPGSGKGKGKGKDKGDRKPSEIIGNSDAVHPVPKPAPKPRPGKATLAKKAFSAVAGQWCRSHTRDGKCESPDDCGLIHNPTCRHWATQAEDSCGCKLGKNKCPFPHRIDVKSSCPKGTTLASDGEIQLPPKKSGSDGKPALTMHLAEDSEGGEDK